MSTNNATFLQCSTTGRCAIVIGMLTACALTAPIYLLQIITLIRHGNVEFKQVFFKIYVLNSFWDLVGIFKNLVCNAFSQLTCITLFMFSITLYTSLQESFLPITGFLPGNRCVLCNLRSFTGVTLFAFGLGYMCSRACLITITINRFTAVIMPMRHLNVSLL
jgi:hypothetical protein